MIDCHTHTCNSPDAENTVSELCEQAIALGLDVLAITEHCEVNRFIALNTTMLLQMVMILIILI